VGSDARQIRGVLTRYAASLCFAAYVRGSATVGHQVQESARVLREEPLLPGFRTRTRL